MALTGRQTCSSSVPSRMRPRASAASALRLWTFATLHPALSMATGSINCASLASVFWGHRVVIFLMGVLCCIGRFPSPYRKPWDMAAGSLILTEAGGIITKGDGAPFSIFARSHIAACNQALHDQMLQKIGPATRALGGLQDWWIPEGYSTEQMDP